MKIENIVVREVDGGLFNLTDLHRAAVNKGKAEADGHQPKYFMRMKQTIDLAAEISKGAASAPFRKVMGRNGGTYVCKELVYSYAMWVSPEFHLDVIRCFDSVVAKNPLVIGALDKIGVEVRRSTSELMAIVDESSATLEDLKRHGSDWGSYGAAIRKVKLEATKQLNAVKAEIQLKLDLLG